MHNVPIIEALERYSRERVARFHMPGHKGNGWTENRLARLIGSQVFQFDVTNIPEMDNLHQPQGVIREAERLAAETFGADRTYFLINGSTCGLQALIMTICNPGDRLLVPRNIHRSVLGGIILSGAVPVYYLSPYDPELGIHLGCIPDIIGKALEQHWPVKGIIAVNPTYHGITSDISQLAELAHRYGIPLLVDEAHGPHLRFHEQLPLSSMEQGADAVVHGTHKMLSSFTQASMLHTRGNLIETSRLEAVLRILQSTSTSYLLLSSLDEARALVETNGRDRIALALLYGEQLREKVSKLDGLKTFGKELVGKSGVYGLDLTKVTVSFRQLALSGYQVEKILREEFKIQVEMADTVNVLLLLTSGNTISEVESVAEAMEQIVKRFKLNGKSSRRTGDMFKYPQIPEMVLSPREAFFSAVIVSPLSKALGEISAEAITCYPPGIPIVGPGEKFTQEIIDYILMQREMGASFLGSQDPSLENVLVVR